MNKTHVCIISLMLLSLLNNTVDASQTYAEKKDSVFNRINKRSVAEVLMGGAIIGAGMYFGGDSTAVDRCLKGGALLVGGSIASHGAISLHGKPKWPVTKTCSLAGLVGTPMIMYSIWQQVIEELKKNEVQTWRSVGIGGCALLGITIGATSMASFYSNILSNDVTVYKTEEKK